MTMESFHAAARTVEDSDEKSARVDVFRSSRPTDAEVQLRARRAYEVMRDRMLPSLAPYARARTRNDQLKVELTAGTPRTDGKTIWLRPDIRLGDDLAHTKSLCGTRDDLDRQQCLACRLSESVYATMSHEISHEVEGSFAKIDPADDARIRSILLAAEEECASEIRKIAIRNRFEAQPPRNYAEAANLISPWLLFLVNSLEDARVNTSAYKAGPGLYKIFRADLVNVLEDGIVDLDGSVTLWKDQPLDAQLCISLFVKVSQMIDYRTYFAPEVVAVIDDDPELKKLLWRFDYCKSIDAIFDLAVKILERLRELGYLRRPEEDSEERAIRVAIITDDTEDTDDEGDGEEPDVVIDLRTKPSTPKADKADDASGEDDDDATDDDSPSETGSPMAGHKGAEKAETPTAGAGADSDDSDDEDDDDPAADGFVPFDDGADDDEGSSEDDDTDYGDDPFDDDDEDADYDDDDDDDFDFGDPDGADEAGEGDEADSTEIGKVDPYAGVDTAELDIDHAKKLMEKVGRHEAKPVDKDIEREVSRAVMQGDWMDEPSSEIFGVNFVSPKAGAHSYGKITPDTEAVAAASFRCRTIFSENRKAAMERNLRTGRINTKVLGRRAPVGDDHLFQKRRLPSEKSYFVLIGLDLSGSTAGQLRYGETGTISETIKQAAMNQATLLTAAGIDFAMYGHTGSNDHSSGYYNLSVDIYVIKEPGERWNEATVKRLNQVTSKSANLDGHTMEIYRKIIERQRADKKIIMYYTDGAMPCENYEEEKNVLIREIAYCRRHGIEIIGVGIGNDDPSKYGLETVRIDRADDVHKVLDELERKITR